MIPLVASLDIQFLMESVSYVKRFDVFFMVAELLNINFSKFASEDLDSVSRGKNLLIRYCYLLLFFVKSPRYFDVILTTWDFISAICKKNIKNKDSYTTNTYLPLFLFWKYWTAKRILQPSHYHVWNWNWKIEDDNSFSIEYRLHSSGENASLETHIHGLASSIVTTPTMSILLLP